MSRSTRTWFRLAVPALLVIASIVGGLGPVSGASGQVIATATPAVTVSAVASVSPVATAPAMADVPGTSTPAAVVATIVVGVPASVATVVATPDAVATGSVVAGMATVIVTGTRVAGTRVAGTVTPVVSPVATAGAGVPPAGAAGPPGMPEIPGNPWGGMVPGMPGRGGTAGGVAPTPKPVTAVPGSVRSQDAMSGAFTSLAAGYAHTCGLTSGGTAYCWGGNSVGQLGDGTSGNGSWGTSADHALPVAVSGGKTFTSLDAGAFHTCGLTSGGTAYCWGYNGYGQLGDGTTEPPTTPVAVSGGRTFTSLMAGGYHTCGLTSGGTAYCWGANGDGRLGDGTAINRTAPSAVSGLTAVSSVSAGTSHSCAVIISGTLSCWGSNSSGQLGDSSLTSRSTPSTVSGQPSWSTVSAGGAHSCAVTTSGVAYCWGSNIDGQVGDGTSGSTRTVPFPVYDTGATKWAMVSTGGRHTCGVTQTGSGYCWGYNGTGQLGDGSSTSLTVPTLIPGFQWSSISAGDSHTCGITIAGIAYCWGANGMGQLGDGTSGNGNWNNQSANRSVPTAVDVSAIPIPTPVPTATPTATATVSPTPGTPATGKPFTSLAAGHGHTCGLTSSGSAYCWGWNGAGQLGDGTSGTNRTSPVAVSGGLTFTRLLAGSHHSCGLTSGGTAYCWGRNLEGELGDGTTDQRTSPVAVSGGRTFTSLVAGALHTCGLTSGGTAYCWGYNGSGQLGDGTGETNLPSPVPVSGGLAFTRLIAGSFHTCGLASGGTAYCWGNNASGQLGDGTNQHHTTPVAVAGGLTFSSLVAGEAHTCGLASVGTAYCWGRNGSGQLGDGTRDYWGSTSDRTVPVAVTGGLIFETIQASGWHTCAITKEIFSAYCWGSNGYGQIGDGAGGSSGNTDDRVSPVRVSTYLQFKTLALGGIREGFSCGLTVDLKSYCWGYNAEGQLGSGTTAQRLSPVAVDVSAIPMPTPVPTATPTATATASPTPVVTPAIRSIRIANVRDTSFTVSWVTGVASTGSIRWGPDDGSAPMNAVYDKRGASGTFAVHFATVSGLAPSTGYRFDVVSGSTTDTNGGAHYLVTTGPTLGATAPDQALGTVSLRDGSVPASVVVHLTASGPSGTSAPLAALVTIAEQKYWAVNLGNLRTGALDAVFPVAADTILTVTADGGPDGTAASTSTVAVVRAGTLALTLSDEVSQPLQAGWNLVALRATPATSMTASMVCTALNAVQSGTAVELDRWINGGWDGHRCGLPVNDFTLEPGPGYFVRLTRPAPWTYRGSVVANPATLSLFTGWNLVGASAISGTPSVASATCSQLNTVQAGTAVELDRWIDGGWEGHRCGLPVNDFTLQSGQGYFIRLTRPATWAPVGAAPVSASSIRNTTEASTPVAPPLGVVRP